MQVFYAWKTPIVPILGKNMKIAIVHEMLIKLWGAERVLQELLKMYPEADIYTLLYDEKKVGDIFPKEKIHCTGPAQWLFQLTKKPRASLPLMTFSVTKINLSGYDLVISSSSGFAHGVNLAHKQRGNKTPFHICYCHSPARYLWDWTEQVQGEMKSFFRPWVRLLFAVLRKIDLQASKSPDIYIANSREVQTRIQKYYHRNSVIVWPPVDIERFVIGETPISERNFYVITSALTPFKRVDIAVRILSKLNISLKIIGSGAQEEELKKMAGSSIEFLGRLSDTEIADVYKNARWFLMPQKEDAGIAPLEAMAAGLPIFWQAAWGLLETSIDGVTGRFFPEETDESFEKYFSLFDKEISAEYYDNSEIFLSHVRQFSTDAFQSSFYGVVDKK